MESTQVSLLIEENLRTIYAYALSRVSNREDAEDLAGDIVLAILTSAPNLRDDHAFFGYIWKIAANTYKKFLRKKKKHRYAELDDAIGSGEPDALEVICQASDINALRRELSILSKEYRECTVAYYVDGMSCAEISEQRGISLEMVKYYLFKTRKILKEGIGMERQFGERSYNPSVFEFITIFSGKFNREYQNLFNRKLPGNILVSAYYTPMTIRELAIELGVASVYLEDEIKLLVKYGLLTELPRGKYQTALVIFTEAYQKRFIAEAETEYTAELGNIIKSIKSKLHEVRKMDFKGNDYTDDHLIWTFLFPLMREGFRIFEEKHPNTERKNKLYDGATGVYYGVDYVDSDAEYVTQGFSGYNEMGDDRYAIFADFGILPVDNHFGNTQDDSTAPIISEEQYHQIETILSDEIEMFEKVYEHLSDCAVKIMKEHAPKAVGEFVGDVINQTLFFRTVGIFGALAVHSGELALPNDQNIKPVLICTFTAN